LEGPGFEFIPHTADIAVRLRAASLGGLFESAAAAFTEAVTSRGTVQARQSRAISLDAPETDLLLVDWLEELLFLFETEDLLVARAEAEVDVGARARLRATIHGERRDPARHAVKVLIKAVTYHGLKVERTDEGYAATIIFDI
jgi:SHS2 domain-containing protein